MNNNDNNSRDNRDNRDNRGSDNRGSDNRGFRSRYNNNYGENQNSGERSGERSGDRPRRYSNYNDGEMRLNNMGPNDGARRDSRRVGRGESSGWGKSAGRGGNGQTARSGSSSRPSFEGGQTPYFKRVPKRGFSNENFKQEYSLVNLDALNNNFENGDTVDVNNLMEKGLISRKDLKVKVLAAGELDKKLTVLADKFSARAKERIEELGGKAEFVGGNDNE